MTALAPANALASIYAIASIYSGGVFVSHSLQVIAAVTSPLAPAHSALYALIMATPVSLSWIGWVATAVFVCSYFAKSASRLRMIQAVAALLWMLYGIAIGAMPVIVANAIVAVAAGFSSLRGREKSAASNVA